MSSVNFAKKLQLIIMILIVVICGNLTSCIAKSNFEYSDLTVTPHKGVLKGDPVEIGVQVRNSGTQTQGGKISLYINNKLTDSREISLAPSETKAVTFTVIQKESGDYNVEIGGLTGYYHVYSSTSQ